MTEFINFMATYWQAWLNLFKSNNMSFWILGIHISVFDIMIACLAMYMVISIFWRGARAG